MQGSYVTLVKKDGKTETALIIMNMNTVASLTQGKFFKVLTNRRQRNYFRESYSSLQQRKGKGQEQITIKNRIIQNPINSNCTSNSFIPTTSSDANERTSYIRTERYRRPSTTQM